MSDLVYFNDYISVHSSGCIQYIAKMKNAPCMIDIYKRNAMVRFVLV